MSDFSHAVMYGGLGNDLFAANDLLNANVFTPNDLVSVEDFVSGQDKLALSKSVSAQSTNPLASGFLFKDFDPAAATAADALSAANSTFASHPAAAYVFVYGGSGAGYLFSNGDGGGTAANDGMILAGDDGEASLSANDIIASPFAV